MIRRSDDEVIAILDNITGNLKALSRQLLLNEHYRVGEKIITLLVKWEDDTINWRQSWDRSGDKTAQSETYKRLAEHHDHATLAEKISNIPTILKIITGH